MMGEALDKRRLDWSEYKTDTPQETCEDRESGLRAALNVDILTSFLFGYLQWMHPHSELNLGDTGQNCGLPPSPFKIFLICSFFW